ncbi:MAG TPA: phage holin family protein, partial [Nakamurella sp.]|nr:phage holin family protein [Nakamurella sp.]
AKAELTQTAKNAGKGAGMFGGAGYAAHLVLLFLSLAVWWAIGTAIGLGWSALIVAAIWTVIAAVLAVLGRAEFARVTGLKRTTETVKKIPNAVKGDEELNR